MGSTYAWIISSDERVNRAEENQKKLSAKITGDLDPVLHWAPGTVKTKQIKVKNNGEVPAIVRLSLTESFVSFETDAQDNHDDGNGNGDLTVYPTPVLPVVNVKDTSTWIVGKTYEMNANTHYKANYALKDQPYAYRGPRTEPLPAIQLNFPNGKVFDENEQPAGTDKAYWYYENGYFYYSEVLRPNEETSNLLDSVALNAAYANRYKGAFYKLVPAMDAHDITKGLLSDWGIQSTDYVYSLYQSKLSN
ncbi:alternate signal-mediated exported protein [Enterococcus pallens]|nr:alternate signal-mediated exported protein [Enterococcus pallens]